MKPVIPTVVAGLMLCGCSGGSRSVPSPTPSPSGKHSYTLECVDQLVHVSITDVAAGQTQIVPTNASCIHRFRAEWRSDEDILVDSSDIGWFRVVRRDDRWNAVYDSGLPSTSGKWHAQIQVDNDLRIVVQPRYPDGARGGNAEDCSVIRSEITIQDLDPKYRVFVGQETSIVGDCLRWETDQTILLDTLHGVKKWTRQGKTDWRPAGE